MTLKRGRPPRVEMGHPWIYRGEIAAITGEPEPGAVVEVVTAGGRRLGWGYVNPQSMIAVRLLSRPPAGPPDEGFWREGLAKALARRRPWFAGATAYRVCNGEGDGLPGLVVDRYGAFLVVESLTAGVERQLGPIVDALVELMEPQGILLRADAPVRRLEGLDGESRLIWGEAPPRPLAVEEDGIRFAVDPWEGQKTGHFFDQRLNRRKVRQLARGRRVLDAFCHTGGFALAAAQGGAREVVAVDSSAPALALARANAEANGLADRIRFQEANAFDLLRRLDREGQRFDLVVLDPPAFAKGRSSLPGALRGYKEINLRAMRLLNAGGILATASCSQPLDRATFLEVLRAAAADVHRPAHLLELAGASPDHPALLAAPETDYLKFAVLVLEGMPPPPTLARAPAAE